MTTHPAQRPSTLHPPLLAGWMTELLRNHVVFEEELPVSGAIFTTYDLHTICFEGLYTRLLSDRSGYLFPSGTGEQAHTISLTALQDDTHSDILVPIAEDKTESRIDVIEALKLARGTYRQVIPVGFSLGAEWPGIYPAVPLPGARLVTVFEVAFTVPEEPSEIPENWIGAILQRLERADGLASDRLATWKRHGAEGLLD